MTPLFQLQYLLADPSHFGYTEESIFGAVVGEIFFFVQIFLHNRSAIDSPLHPSIQPAHHTEVFRGFGQSAWQLHGLQHSLGAPLFQAVEPRVVGANSNADDDAGNDERDDPQARTGTWTRSAVPHEAWFPQTLGIPTY
ncbi:hypothetical protein EDC04DRAFT_2609306 [Pisolithus marmoratus]|nr:hypothetical protein EDC04DRAFT_2609306 [Pisolithus marmoratus]